MLFSVLFEPSVVTDCFIHKGEGDRGGKCAQTVQ